MKYRVKLFYMIFVMVLLVSCGVKQEKPFEPHEIVYYENFQGVQDFGNLSGISPEVEYSEEFGETTYLYVFNNEVEKKIVTYFYDSLEEGGYNQSEWLGNDSDDGDYSLFENGRIQVLVGYYLNEGLTKKLVVSMRQKYKSYTDFPDIPDFGDLSETELFDSDTTNGITSYFYNGQIAQQYSKYIEALSDYEFKIIHDKVMIDDGILEMYSNGTHNVMIGLYPKYLSITISK